MAANGPLPAPMTSQLVARNLDRYRLFEAIAITPVMLPVLVLFFEENGLSLRDVFVLQAVFAVSAVLLEVPTGMVADRIGKKTSLIASMAVSFIGCVLYALCHSFWAFLGAELVLALGLALYSGASDALLYDSLKYLKRESEYADLQGRARAIALVVFAACNLLGGVLGEISLRATLWASAVGPGFGLLIARGFVEVNPHARGLPVQVALQGYKVLLGDALRFVRRQRLVQWNIALLALFSGSASWLLWLYQPYMQLSGLPIWAFGGAFALFNLFAAFASHQTGLFEQRLGPTGALLVLMGLQVAPLVAMAVFVAPWAFLFILGHQAVRGLAKPILTQRILRHTYADKRATVLSLSALSGRLFFAVTAPIIGWYGESTSIPHSLLGQAVVLAALFGLLLAIYQQIPSKYFQVKSQPTEGSG